MKELDSFDNDLEELNSRKELDLPSEDSKTQLEFSHVTDKKKSQTISKLSKGNNKH